MPPRCASASGAPAGRSLVRVQPRCATAATPRAWRSSRTTGPGSFSTAAPARTSSSRDLRRRGPLPPLGHLLIGHAHWDHIQGFPFFEPLYDPRSEWRVYAAGDRTGHLKQTFARQMSPEHHPIALGDLNASVRFRALTEGSFDGRRNPRRRAVSAPSRADAGLPAGGRRRLAGLRDRSRAARRSAARRADRRGTRASRRSPPRRVSRRRRSRHPRHPVHARRVPHPARLGTHARRVRRRLRGRGRCEAAGSLPPRPRSRRRRGGQPRRAVASACRGRRSRSRGLRRRRGPGSGAPGLLRGRRHRLRPGRDRRCWRRHPHRLEPCCSRRTMPQLALRLETVLREDGLRLVQVSGLAEALDVARLTPAVAVAAGPGRSPE